jgi:hypothetical protein
MTEYKSYLEGRLDRISRKGKPRWERNAMRAFEVSQLTIGTKDLPQPGHTKVIITSTCEPVDGSALGVKPWKTEYDHWEDAYTKTGTRQVFNVTFISPTLPDSSIQHSGMDDDTAKDVSEAWERLRDA